MNNEIEKLKEFIKTRKLETAFKVFNESEKYIGLEYWMVMTDQTIKKQIVEGVIYDNYQNSKRFLLNNGNGSHYYREDEIDKKYARIFTTKEKAYKCLIASNENSIDSALHDIEYHRKMLKHWQTLYDKEIKGDE